MPSVTRILGIDPGSVITGWGIVDSSGSRLVHVADGAIRTGGGEFPDRLRVIFEAIGEVTRDYEPDEVAVEKVFVSKNVDSALKLGQARGAAICGTLVTPVQVFEYSPTEIKRAVVGSGSAAKEQVQHMIRAILSLRSAVQPDAADALAVAVCRANLRAATARIAAATTRQKR